ncbi:MAG: helix-turn-helix domain-containing protein [Terriglobia bacterium]
MASKTRFKSPALNYAYGRYIGKHEAKAAAFAEELANAEIAGQIHRLRTKAGLSQRQLAAKIGTTASVICRLEDADYTGQSLPMLRRIAAALNKRVEIRFVPAGRKTSVA